jgi:hypothetical protein
MFLTSPFIDPFYRSGDFAHGPAEIGALAKSPRHGNQCHQTQGASYGNEQQGHDPANGQSDAPLPDGETDYCLGWQKN